MVGKSFGGEPFGPSDANVVVNGDVVDAQQPVDLMRQV